MTRVTAIRMVRMSHVPVMDVGHAMGMWTGVHATSTGIVTMPRPPSYGNYQYASDMGVSSIAGLTELARSSGLDFRVGSAYRNEDGSWHGQSNAIDIFASRTVMTQLATYLVQFEHYLAELLYTPPNSVQRPDGRWAPVIAVDNGARLNSLSDKTAREHGGANAHVHLAATNSALWALSEDRPKLLLKWQIEQKKNPSGGSSTVDPRYGVTSGNNSTRLGCWPKAAAVFVGLPAGAGLITYIAGVLIG